MIGTEKNEKNNLLYDMYFNTRYVEDEEKKDKYLKSTYGISIEDFYNMLYYQEHKCAICRAPFADNNKPVVDHCHKTDKVRGLLCSLCNMGLGAFKDSARSLRVAIRYLS